MNRRAVAWGMTDTHYDDPSGLSVGSQSTASDLVVLTQKIYTAYPQILTITRTPQVTLTEISSGDQVVVKSINEFSGRIGFHRREDGLHGPGGRKSPFGFFI